MYYQTDFQKVQYNDVDKSVFVNQRKKQKTIKNEASSINQCKICGLVNFNAWSLTMHMRRHNNDKPAKCSFCPASFVNNTELKSHLSTHTKEKNYKCRFCPKWFANKSSKYVHEDTHGILEHKCKFCQIKFPTQIERRIHQKTHGREDLSCRFCIKKFVNEEFLRLHEQTDHAKSLNCIKCKLKFKTQEQLQAHKGVHKTTRRVAISKKSNEVRYFQDSDVKLSSYFFTCGICFQRFSFQLDLSKHIETFHPSEEKESIYRFKCVICNKSFDTKMKLRGHMVGHGPKKHKCPHCSYCSTRGKDLSKHVDAKHSGGKNFKCSECGMQFTYYSTFVLHKLKHGEKKFKCDMCDKSYYVKSRLSNHKRISHYSANPVCEQCGKVFRNILTLRSHQRSFHNRPIALCLCNNCGKTLYVNEVGSHQERCSVENYSESSQKLKGPQCSACSITFSTHRDLLDHFKELHPTLVYPCKFCHKEYLSQTLTQKHIERKHMPNKQVFKKRKHIFSTDEKRELKKSTENALVSTLFECFACGKPFVSQFDTNEHLDRCICIQSSILDDHKNPAEIKQNFNVTKLYENNGCTQVLNDFEVQVTPGYLNVEPLDVTSYSPKDNSGSKKQNKKLAVQTKVSPAPPCTSVESLFNTLDAEVGISISDSIKILNGDSSSVSQAQETDKIPSHKTQTNISFESGQSSVVSSQDLLKLLQNKTINVDGTPFISLNELFENLKCISGIDISNG